MATKNLTVFLNYKNSTVKCLITKSLKSEIQFLQTQFPGRIFPANTILINKRTKLAVSNLNDISVLSGDVISVKIPRTQSRPVPLENVLHLKTVKKDSNLIKLKKIFKLDEKTFAENFIFDEKFGKDGIEISCFLELPDNISIENVLSKNNKVFEDKVIAVERLSDKTRDRYNNLKRKMKVVYVKNCPDDTVAADLRIFFPDIAIYAAHILSSGVAFLETTESQIDSLLHYNNKPNLLAGHKLELRESNYENLCEALRKSNFEAEEKKRQDHLNQKRKKSDSVTEEYSLAKRPTDFDKTGNKQNLVKNENLSSSTTKKAKYINEDFKCAKMTNIPSGCSELDVARFFDDAKIQPISLHLKKDGSAVYCEFETIRECDKAIELNTKEMNGTKVSIFRVKYSEIRLLENSKVVDDHNEKTRDFPTNLTQKNLFKTNEADFNIAEEIGQINNGMSQNNNENSQNFLYSKNQQTLNTIPNKNLQYPNDYAQNLFNNQFYYQQPNLPQQQNLQSNLPQQQNLYNQTTSHQHNNSYSNLQNNQYQNYYKR